MSIMNEWMNEWMKNERVNEWIDSWMNKRTNDKSVDDKLYWFLFVVVRVGCFKFDYKSNSRLVLHII